MPFCQSQLIIFALFCVALTACEKDPNTPDNRGSKWAGKIAGHEYVDLGLPSGFKWATCNVGASSPEEFGDYFAWGETEPYYGSLYPLTWKEGKSNGYAWVSYKWCDGNDMTMTKYNNSYHYGYYVDNRTVLGLEDDAAHANWGSSWRTPTNDDFEELLDNCTAEWTTLNSVNGYKFTGNNGKSIFLPAAGDRRGTDLTERAGSLGGYWSSTLDTKYPCMAKVLGFISIYAGGGSSDRHCGCTVRPISGKVAVTGVSLNKNSTTLTICGSTMIMATVDPSNATDMNVSWRSSNTSVATVDADGFVTAIAPGTATITVTTVDGGKTAECEVIVQKPQYVDLGLPSGLKWATCNVGANSPEEYGDYFAWGETYGKGYYDWTSYFWCNGSYRSFTKYNTYSSYGKVDNKTTLDYEDDAARANWGDSWRIPSWDDFDELLVNCTSEWTTQNGVIGRLFTSKTNGNSIFLPASGVCYNYNLDGEGTEGAYWSSSLYTDQPDSAWGLVFYSNDVVCFNDYRYLGFSIRPISGKVAVTGVSLNKSSITFTDASTEKLTATIAPSNATNKSVSWGSSNTSVATVDANGIVTAVASGIATITVTTLDGGKTAECTVTSYIGNEVGHHYVDLDLPSGLKWATCNVGANAPEEYGDYFAWGETEPYYSSMFPHRWKDGKSAGYNWGSYKFGLGTDYHGPFSKYVTDSFYGTVDNKTVLSLDDDAAHANWGGSWRMPTIDDLNELVANCTSEWHTQNGVSGILFTSKTSGSSIFLPAPGFFEGNDIESHTITGLYWSSSLYTDCPGLAWGLFYNFLVGDYFDRCLGLPIRPVIE